MRPPHEEPTPVEQYEQALHYASILMGTNLSGADISKPTGFLEEAHRRATEARWGDVLLPLAAEHWTVERYREEEEGYMVDVRAGRCMEVQEYQEVFGDKPRASWRHVRDNLSRIIYMAHWPAGQEPWTTEAYQYCLDMMVRADDNRIQIWRRRAARVWAGLKEMECR